MRSSPKIEPPASGAPLANIAAGREAAYRPELGFSLGTAGTSPGGAPFRASTATSTPLSGPRPAKKSGASRRPTGRVVGPASGRPLVDGRTDGMDPGDNEGAGPLAPGDIDAGVKAFGDIDVVGTAGGAPEATGR